MVCRANIHPGFSAHAISSRGDGTLYSPVSPSRYKNWARLRGHATSGRTRLAGDHSTTRGGACQVALEPCPPPLLHAGQSACIAPRVPPRRALAPESTRWRQPVVAIRPRPSGRDGTSALAQRFGRALWLSSRAQMPSTRKPAASISSSVNTSAPPLRFSAMSFLSFLSSALVGGFFFFSMVTSLPRPSV